MRVLGLITFRQPNSDTIITLQRMETPFYPPLSCERLVDEHCQEGIYGIEATSAQRIMKQWIGFERKIKSTQL